MTNSGYEMVVSAEALQESLRYARAIAWRFKYATAVLYPLGDSTVLDVYDSEVGLAHVPIEGAVGAPAPYPIALPLQGLMSRIATLRGDCSLRAAGTTLVIEATESLPNGKASTTVITVSANIPGNHPWSPPAAVPASVDATLSTADVERLAKIYSRCWRHLSPAHAAAVAFGHILVPYNSSGDWRVVASSDYQGEQAVIIPTDMMRVLAARDGSKPWGPMQVWVDPAWARVVWHHVDGLTMGNWQHDIPRPYKPPRFLEEAAYQETQATALLVPAGILLRALQTPTPSFVCLHISNGLVSVATDTMTLSYPAEGYGKASCLVKTATLRMALRDELVVDFRIVRTERLPLVLIRGRELEWIIWSQRGSSYGY